MERQIKDGLTERAKQLRRDALQMIYEANSGHPGGSLSLADIMAYLYFRRMRYKVADPKWQGRDRFILSKGHAAPILYAALGEAGFFPWEEFHHLRQINGLLQGHPCISIPGVDASTGSLGLGLSMGAGMAMGAKRRGLKCKVHVVMGDGELDEGQIWEAAMAAPRFELDNLVAVVDRNGYQNDGATEEIMPLESLADKWKAFGWHVVVIDGHDFDQIDHAFLEADQTLNKPSVIIAHTVKGKGVSYMLDQPQLHYTPPTQPQFMRAMEELA